MKIINSMKLLLVLTAMIGYGVMNGYCCSTPVDHCSYTILFSGDNWTLVDTANANKVMLQGTGGYTGARAAICPNATCKAAKHNAFNHYCAKGQSASI